MIYRPTALLTHAQLAGEKKAPRRDEEAERGRAMRRMPRFLSHANLNTRKKPFITARLLLRVDTKDTFYRSTISVLTTREISTSLADYASVPAKIPRQFLRH